MKAFTASSMAVGFACSCAGPLKDTYGAYRVRSRAVESGLAAELHVRTSPDVSGAADIENETSHFLEEEAQPTSQPQGPSEGVARGDQPAPPSTGDARGEGRSRRGVMLYSGSVLSFIQEGRARHSVAAHRVLVICALMYWVGMALLPVLFGSSITGGIDASVPQAAVLYFFLLNVCSILGELWIVIHTEVGHYMIFFTLRRERVQGGHGQRHGRGDGCRVNIIQRTGSLRHVYRRGVHSDALENTSNYTARVHAHAARCHPTLACSSALRRPLFPRLWCFWLAGGSWGDPGMRQEDAPCRFQVE
ncbi:unnamed protein product [Prorocentrum cordatum]|uniref:Uncharacterized protein n=1 Tax=Prorocentrum cordatum TaxID=2364126 RepID=A0ABN9XG33_9DINO|nr:unnamed protein product [Polarella glacialis]